MRLKNKVAIVTGGGGGIGEGIVNCLAKEGANMVVADVNWQSAKKVVAGSRFQILFGREFSFLSFPQLCISFYAIMSELLPSRIFSRFNSYAKQTKSAIKNKSWQ